MNLSLDVVLAAINGFHRNIVTGPSLAKQVSVTVELGPLLMMLLVNSLETKLSMGILNWEKLAKSLHN